MELIQQLSTLTSNEPQLRILIDMIPEFIVLKDGDGRWLVTNKLVLTSYEMGEDYSYHGKTDSELAEIFPRNRDNFMFNVETDKMAWDKGQTIHIEKSFHTPDGILRTWEVIKTPLFDKDGNRSHLIIVSREITARKKAEKALKLSEFNYRLIAENMKDVLITIDHEGIITFLSPSFEKVTGYSIHDYMNRKAITLMEYIHQNDYEYIKKFYQDLIYHGKKFNSNFEYQFRKKDGRYIWLEANVNTIYNSEGKFEKLIIVARDIIQRKKYQTQLEAMAYYDHLTDIPNRRLFMNTLSLELEKAASSNQILALLYLDIDYFKEVNDQNGHEVGDQLLIQLTKRIQHTLRESDLLARIGGDEFVVILPNLSSEEQAKIIGERIVNKLKEPWHIEEQIFQTTSSIGIAMYPKDGTTSQMLIRHSDEALYTAKAKGRALVEFYQ
ncbi:diguanylate cyclase (GGDEF)-like protein/PAS domain S-box-containing protein [Metabacillus crassostreae]|uniref:sensor domain-containing protein n=1 Tax=Metabacillus crassostreae TaxID=929098 RepID=UPI0019568CB4|nr:sensor domain-containing diguanylate cyclase [Metabacillus crassostreae]MBM7602377.1 diguanylate cyclase (GGDEF)-like protein/PAS domain S-box-containing protein [Metabacillus crassostreae]